MRPLLYLFLCCLPGLPASAQEDFAAALGSIRQDMAAAQDNTRVQRPLPPAPLAERVNQPGSAEYLFELYGQDFNRHAVWHMDLLSLYRRGGANGARPPLQDALASVRALSVLGAGAQPLVSGDTLYWLPKELSAVLKYAPDAEARGAAALALGVVLAAKDAAAAREALDSLASSVRYASEEFEVRRFAVMALAGSGQKYAVEKLKAAARALAASHDFIGRGKFRYEEDESSWSLEASIIKAFESMLPGPAGTEALAALKYFAHLYNSTCGNFTVIKLPDDDGIDETLLVNARLALAQNGGMTWRHLRSNRDYPETGSVKCLLPVINDGDLCELRKTAATLFRQIHGDVIYATGSYIEGRADCNELITNKVMLEFSKIYLTGLGTGALVKGAISVSVKGLRAVAGIQHAAKVAQYKKFMDMAYGYYDRAGRIKGYTEYMAAMKKASR
ncbi:MAG: hypothetical protein CVU79_07925 [Elusimicrobia bacterium HGW-Elusimicrobia-3]|jgi:hypothetical protein|nr:MAG: hypothetical protein CVU79_07925 [Elusimicrobia bacterium HGW-Elusimicrobia-3]